MPAFLRFLTSSAIFLPIMVCHAQSDAAGYILKASGAWIASQNGQDRPLKAGAAVNPGDKLHSTPADAVLGLVLYDGTYLKCGRPNPDASAPQCRQPIQIPARSKPQGVISAFLDRLQNKHLPPVAFVTSRGPGSGPPPVELGDGIVPAAGGGLDFSRVLSAAAAVELHFYLEPLDAPPGCGALLFKLPPAARTAQAEDLQERCNGLYQLSATDASMQSTYPATVLLVAPGAEVRASRMLDDAAGLAARWQFAGEDEKRTFRRLTLSAIQQEMRSRH